MDHQDDIVIQPTRELEEALPLTDWATISHFEVLVNKRSKFNARVFANGWQQVPVEVLIQARDADGVAVSLTDAQLDSIRLIDYSTGDPILDVDSTHDERFVYHWDGIAAEDDGNQSAEGSGNDAPKLMAQSEMRYVRKYAVSTNKVAAEITSPSGGVFRTNTPSPPAGKFDSWVNVQGMEVPRYDHTDLIMERVDEVSNAVWDVDLYYIRFSSKDFRIVRSSHLDASGDSPHLNKIHNGSQSRFHIAFTAGGKRTITFAPNGSMPGVTFEVNKRVGEATAARCIVQRSLYYQEGRTDACLLYYNQYGNPARCALGNTYTNDYNMISLGRITHE